MENHLNYTRLFLVSFFIFLFTLTSNAHAPDQSYIFLRVYDDAMAVRIEMEVDDINAVLGLNLKKGITEEELEPFRSQIEVYMRERASFSTDEKVYGMKYTGLEIIVLDLGTFILLDFDLEGSEVVPDKMNVSYSGIFDKVPNHQGMLVIEYNWKAGVFNNEALVSLIFTPSSIQQELDLTGSSVMKGFFTMIWMGVWHIFIGLDHILFLLALVLPAVVYRLKEDEKEASYYNPVQLPGFGVIKNQWNPVNKFRPAIIFVLTIVTFFTISHCITLSLAALQIVELPSRFVESIIAFSIALAALHIFRPLFKKDWYIAFGFGLFHGFGFASVLGDIGLKGEYLTLSLLGFNLGVELGQVAIICVVFPILYYMRKSRNFSKVLVYGAVLLITISLYWMVERVFDIDLLLDNYISIAISKALALVGLG